MASNDNNNSTYSATIESMKRKFSELSGSKLRDNNKPSPKHEKMVEDMSDDEFYDYDDDDDDEVEEPEALSPDEQLAKQMQDQLDSYRPLTSHPQNGTESDQSADSADHAKPSTSKSLPSQNSADSISPTKKLPSSSTTTAAVTLTPSNPATAAATKKPFSFKGATNWDPLEKSKTIDTPSLSSLNRIYNDIREIHVDQPTGISVVPDSDNMTKIHALIIGPEGTPYEGGFFYFVMQCPSDYPIKPPRVRLMTTGNGRVRFNPNLYANGKVCLSILGTWSGPAWSSVQNIASVLISIQSLMNEKPYHNEPGYEKCRRGKESQKYNEVISHETLRVAVCDMLEGKVRDTAIFKDDMEKQYRSRHTHYISVCDRHSKLQGKDMDDPFGGTRGKYDFTAIRKRLKTIKSRLDETDKKDADIKNSDLVTHL